VCVRSFVIRATSTKADFQLPWNFGKSFSITQWVHRIRLCYLYTSLLRTIYYYLLVIYMLYVFISYLYVCVNKTLNVRVSLQCTRQTCQFSLHIRHTYYVIRCVGYIRLWTRSNTEDERWGGGGAILHFPVAPNVMRSGIGSGPKVHCTKAMILGQHDIEY